MSNEITPLPWRPSPKCSDAVVSDKPSHHHLEGDHLEYYGGYVVCESANGPDVRFIVRACNAFDDMLSALKAVMAESVDGGFDDLAPGAFEEEPLADQIRKAIAKAESP